MTGYTKYTYALSAPPLFPQRKGVVIKWSDGRFSEASPLPGWSQESFEEVRDSFPLHAPSVDFALDARHHSPISVPVCALLAGSREQIKRDALELEKNGFAHAKLKLNKFSLQEAIEITKDLVQRFFLRLDFNRSLSLEDALYFAQHFQEIDFYEEPLKNPQELQYFPYPIGLDESLREPQHHNLVHLPQVKAIVIKPTMIGGLKACKAWTSFGKQVVLSSSFESGIGILQIMHLSQELNSAPLGIDTYRFFKEDLLEEPIRFSNGFAHAPEKLLYKIYLIRNCL